MKHFLFLLLPLLGWACQPASSDGDQPVSVAPNFVVVLCDDLGYGDVEAFASTVIETPRLNQLAEQGLKLTS